MIEYLLWKTWTGLTVPKWVLIVWPKIPPMPQNLSAQFVCPSPKVLDFNEKRLHWASIVRGFLKAKKHDTPLMGFQSHHNSHGIVYSRISINDNIPHFFCCHLEKTTGIAALSNYELSTYLVILSTSADKGTSINDVRLYLGGGLKRPKKLEMRK